jgi:hypothetical protein
MTYSRTPAGEEELVAKKLPLSIPTRRLLGLIVGTISAESLAAMAKFGEVDRMQELIERGLVQSTEPLAKREGVPPTPEPARTPPPVIALTPERATTIKRQAARFVYDSLGPSGETLALQIERAGDVSALENELHEVRRILGEVRGRSVADKFYETVITSAFGSGS